MEAEYKVAKEKCDALSGDAKSACLAQAKAQYQALSVTHRPSRRSAQQCIRHRCSIWRRTAGQVFLALVIVIIPTLTNRNNGRARPALRRGSIASVSAAGRAPGGQSLARRGSEAIRWGPPNCTGWDSSSRSKLVLAMAGSFRFDGTADEVVERIGAISTLPGVRYWSVTDRAWRPLVVDASALSRPDRHSRRGDFLAAEMATGRELYYWELHRRSGNIVNRMTVLERSPARAVIATENVTPVRIFFMTLFEPGTLQSVAFVELIAPGVWGVYFLSRAGQGASALAVGREESYVNVATAMYEHLAGIQSSGEPPTRHLAGVRERSELDQFRHLPSRRHDAYGGKQYSPTSEDRWAL